MTAPDAEEQTRGLMLFKPSETIPPASNKNKKIRLGEEFFEAKSKTVCDGAEQSRL
jgi:hypothetical protein